MVPVSVANEADLRQVDALTAILRHTGIHSASVITPVKTLAQLGITTGREVIVLDTDGVSDEIERLVVNAALSIINGDGFCYDVPSKMEDIITTESSFLDVVMSVLIFVGKS